MSLELITPPAVEPVSLASAKAHLRVDTNDDDALITRLITVAREAAEKATGRALIAQSWRLWLDVWPASRVIELPWPPLIAVTAVTTYDRNDTASVLATTAYIVDLVSLPGRVVLKETASLPVSLREANAIAIDFQAGYGAGESDVPAGIVAGALALIAHYYESRGDKDLTPPAQALALLAPYRVLAL